MAGGAIGLVPVVDLGGDPHELGRAIDRACRQVGFFQIVGHGVDPAIESAAWLAAIEFFRLPLEDKLAVANWDAVIECLPTCVETDAAPRHAPITAGRHLMDKFLSTQT